MNIILNGNNSNEISGLLISTLPPISKPQQRVNTETIDGRDGDIITPLGYSAYDKKISIGLYGNYDVDEVIAYFVNNQKGQVTFSNEPDKYYNYEIIEQIDFEKLIRFKTADVTFHTQPFKYSTTDEAISYDVETTTKSGTSIDITEPNPNLISLVLDGNSTQGENPTPDYPQEIESISGDIVICGKNLFNGWVKNQRVLNSNGAVQTQNNYISTNAIKVKPNTSYIVSGLTFDGGNKFVAYYEKDNTYISRTGSSNVNEISFTTPSNCEYVRVALNNVFDNETSMNNYVSTKQVQLEQGTTNTDYEPYQGVTIPLGTTELCKIGDISDKLNIDLVTGIVSKVGNIGSLTLNGTENWNTFFATNGIYTMSLTNKSVGTDTINAMSDYFTGTKRSTIRSNLNNTSIDNLVATYNTELIFAYRNKTSVNDFKTWLGTNNPTVKYQLATPTNENITTLSSDDLSNLTSLLHFENSEGTNMTLTLTSSSCSVTNNGNTYSRPLLKITGSGTINLYLNGIQLFVINLGDTSTTINIDTNLMEAYANDNTLMNRQVTGNYNNFKFNVGSNEITWNGNITNIEIDNYSRWV